MTMNNAIFFCLPKGEDNISLRSNPAVENLVLENRMSGSDTYNLKPDSLEARKVFLFCTESIRTTTNKPILTINFIF